MELLDFAVVPVHNLELPRRKCVLRIGQFRIVQVHPWTYGRKRIPAKVIREMNRHQVLSPWVSTLEEGYWQNVVNTPRFVVFFFPSPEVSAAWFSDDGDSYAEMIVLFDAFLAALRLYKREYVSIPGLPILTKLSSKEPAMRIILEARQERIRTPVIPSMYEPRYLQDAAPYVVRSTDAALLEELVAKTRVAFGTRLGMALRRFLSSQDNEDADRFIDLLVALEVLYGDEDPTAAGHKIAFRAATVAGESTTHRARLFRLLKKAYGSRSAILHGRSAGTDSANLNEVEEITRRSLKWFIDKTAETGEAPDGKDVDKLCFDSTPLQV